MSYKEIIQSLVESLLINFNEVYYNAETIVNDDGQRLPAIPKLDEYISLAPTDQKETIYIRRNGDDEVMEENRIGSCVKSYKMRTPIRIVYFQDHAKQHNKIINDLMQAVLIGGTKLGKIKLDKWKLHKEESSGDYHFGAQTAYFAIDIYAIWILDPSTCEEDFCFEEENPLKKNC